MKLNQAALRHRVEEMVIGATKEQHYIPMSGNFNNIECSPSFWN